MDENLTGNAEDNRRMKTVVFRQIFFLVTGALPLLAGAINSSAKSEPREVTPELSAQEREGCAKNLNAIYAAIEGYRRDHKDVPNWFSDLVPDYLPDVNVLVCPVCRRTGETDIPQLSDPRIASSYLFEFCPLPLGNSAPANPQVTRREWKRRQMGMVGSVVPLVRCRHHQPTLNLAFDGRVYDSPPSWEAMLTNMVDPASLTAARMFPAGEAAAWPSGVKKSYPARDAQLRKELLDLTPFYNARLTDTWHSPNNTGENDLAGLTAGLQKLSGIEFDLRGLIQLGGKASGGERFPTTVTGIKVNQKCQKLHFLHAAAFGKPSDEGKQIGTFVLHFAANQMRMEIPIVYGKDVRDWHYWPSEKDGPESLKIVWRGENGVSKHAKSYVRLFETSWTNLVPNLELESIDLVSTMSQPAPFLLAITLE